MIAFPVLSLIAAILHVVIQLASSAKSYAEGVSERSVERSYEDTPITNVMGIRIYPSRDDDLRVQLKTKSGSGMSWYIDECSIAGIPQATAKGDSHAIFERIGKWLVLNCNKDKEPTVSEYFAQHEGCKADPKETEVEIKDARSGKTSQKISFVCSNDNTRITKCKVVGDPLNTEAVAEGTGYFGGTSKQLYQLDCSDVNKPIVTEKFVPEICVQDDSKKLADIVVQGGKKGSKEDKKQIRFKCNTEGTAVTKCIPPDTKEEKVPEIQSTSIDITFGPMWNKYKLRCFNDRLPKITM